MAEHERFWKGLVFWSIVSLVFWILLLNSVFAQKVDKELIDNGKEIQPIEITPISIGETVELKEVDLEITRSNEYVFYYEGLEAKVTCSQPIKQVGDIKVTQEWEFDDTGDCFITSNYGQTVQDDYIIFNYCKIIDGLNKCPAIYHPDQMKNTGKASFEIDGKLVEYDIKSNFRSLDVVSEKITKLSWDAAYDPTWTMFTNNSIPTVDTLSLTSTSGQNNFTTSNFTVTMTCSDADATDTCYNYTAFDGEVFHETMDSSECFDISVNGSTGLFNGNNCTKVGFPNDRDGLISGATQVVGKFGSGIGFDGNQDVINNTLSFVNYQYTFCVWINSNNKGETAGRIYDTPTTAVLHSSVDGSLQFKPNQSDISEDISYSPIFGQWIYICSQKNLTQTSFYINSYSIGNSTTKNLNAVENNIYIGSRKGQDRDYNGTLDNFVFYPCSISSSQINCSGLSPLPIDFSSEPGGCAPTLFYGFDNVNTSHVRSTEWNTLPNYVNDGQVKGIGAGYVFDGVNDYLNTSIPQNKIIETGQYTINVWFKSNNSFGNIYLVSGDANHRYAYIGSEFMKWYNGTSGGQSSEKINNNVLYMGTWVYDVTNPSNINLTTMYINGINKTGTSANMPFRNASGNIYIGSLAGTSNYWNGTIYEVQIWNKALRADEVKELYECKINNRTCKQIGGVNGQTYTAVSVAGDLKTYSNPSLYNFSVADDTTPPLLQNVTNLTATNTTISFYFDVNETSMYNISYGNLNTNLSNNLVNYTPVSGRRYVTISNLAPNITWYYNIVVNDSFGNNYTSTIYNDYTIANALFIPPVTPPAGGGGGGDSGGATYNYTPPQFTCNLGYSGMNTINKTVTQENTYIPIKICNDNQFVSVDYTFALNDVMQGQISQYCVLEKKNLKLEKSTCQDLNIICTVPDKRVSGSLLISRAKVENVQAWIPACDNTILVTIDNTVTQPVDNVSKFIQDNLLLIALLVPLIILLIMAFNWLSKQF